MPADLLGDLCDSGRPSDGVAVDVPDTRHLTDAVLQDVELDAVLLPDQDADETFVGDEAALPGDALSDADGVGEVWDLADAPTGEIEPEVVAEDLLPEWPDVGDELLMTEPVITPNPANVLSCYVTWKTNVATASRVEFQASGEKHFFVASSELVKNHSLFVFGMHVQTSYQLRAFSITGDGAEVSSEYMTFETQGMPFWDVQLVVNYYDAGLAQPGWILTNLSGNASAPAVAVMADEGGIVWYHVLLEVGGMGDLHVSMTEDQHVLIGGGGVPPGESAAEVDFAGNVLWTGPPQPAFFATGYMHHTLQKQPSGNYLSIGSKVLGANLADNVVEFGPDNVVFRSWCTWDHIDELTMKYPWGNMVRLDEAEEMLYFNSAGHMKLLKVDFLSGEIVWQLGKGGDFAAVDPSNSYFWFEVSHAPVILPSGNILVFDNGGVKRNWSRLVEYSIDEESMTAAIVWEYPGDIASDYWYTHCWGSVDRLANGNTLASAACNNDNSTPSRIFEVTAAGEKALEISLSTMSGTFLGSYMAEKVAIPVGVLPDDR